MFIDVFSIPLFDYGKFVPRVILSRVDYVADGRPNKKINLSRNFSLILDVTTARKQTAGVI